MQNARIEVDSETWKAAQEFIEASSKHFGDPATTRCQDCTSKLFLYKARLARPIEEIRKQLTESRCPTCGSDDPSKLRAWSKSGRWVPWWDSNVACKDKYHKESVNENR